MQGIAYYKSLEQSEEITAPIDLFGIGQVKREMPVAVVSSQKEPTMVALKKRKCPDEGMVHFIITSVLTTL